MSVEIADGLLAAGHDAVHVSAYDLDRADDLEILVRADEEDRIIVSADTDFGALLAAPASPVASVVLYRRRTRRRPDEQLMVLLANIPALADDLSTGAIVIIEDRGIRVRRLPIGD